MRQRKPRPPGQIKTQRVTFRLTGDEYEGGVRLAYERGMDLHELLRRLLSAMLSIEHAKGQRLGVVRVREDGSMDAVGTIVGI